MYIPHPNFLLQSSHLPLGNQFNTPTSDDHLFTRSFTKTVPLFHNCCYITFHLMQFNMIWSNRMSSHTVTCHYTRLIWCFEKMNILTGSLTVVMDNMCLRCIKIQLDAFTVHHSSNWLIECAAVASGRNLLLCWSLMSLPQSSSVASRNCLPEFQTLQASVLLSQL